MASSSNYDQLIGKLDAFVRKYYLNSLLRGVLFSLGLILALFLAFSLIEHQFYLSRVGRKIMFFSFLGVSVLAIGRWIILPLTKMLKLGSRISHEQAAAIVGDHFLNVQDKLLNILQLKKSNVSDNELITASINQKADNIRLVQFPKAIDLSKNRKYLRYALPPMLLLLFVLFAAPSLIKDSTYRIINNDTDFERAAPFSFIPGQESFEVLENESLTIDIDIDGSAIPADAFISVDGYQYRMQQDDPTQYSYTFNNVQKDQSFYFFAGKVRSRDYALTVLPKPSLVDFSLYLDYPAYTDRKDERLSNIGDATVPKGTKLIWTFDTESTDALKLRMNNGTTIDANKKSSSSFGYSQKLMKGLQYTTIVSNENVAAGDSVSYRIAVIDDKYPEISVEQIQDSTEQSILYFVGQASDDYGLGQLSFVYEVTDEKNLATAKKEIKIKHLAGSRTINYDHILDLDELSLKPGDRLSYYFEIYDNDGVNGTKSSQTKTLTYEKPSLEDIKELEDQNEEKIKDELSDAIEESLKIKEELKKLREELLQKEELSWQDKQELEKLMERQKELDQKMQNAQEKFEQNLQNQEEYTPQSEEIQSKQEEIQEMFEEVQDPQMQELMEQIQELMQELNKEDALEMMEQLEKDESQMEKEMDRLLELLKQLEVEKEMQETIEALEELAKDQEELAKETEEESKSKDELSKEQKELEEKLEDIKEKLEELEEKNDELEFPKDMGDDNQEKLDDAQQDMQDSQEQMNQGDNKKASESQKKAAQKMSEMASGMQEQMESAAQEQAEEDMAALRQLLENIVNLSFDQEDLVDNIKRTRINTPKYTELVQEQFKIQRDFVMVEDSLQELSKRVTQIETFVTEKVTEIKYDLNGAIDNLEERQKAVANQNQRLAMKNLNDLALMLSESMEQMQQQMAGMMSGSQNCKKPGGGKPKNGKNGSSGPPMDKITEGQEGLSDQLKEMIEKMKQGGKPGAKNGQGQVSSKEFAQAAAKQAALRKALEEIRNAKDEAGEGRSKALEKILDQMDQNEVDLVNKRLDQEMMIRQQEILTRLLEAERADKQREYDNQRQAESAKQTEKTIPPAIQEYIKKREAEIDEYKRVSPALKPYYKELVEKYYESLKADN